MKYSRSENIKGSKELTYSLSVTKPFEVSTLFYTMLFEPLTKGFIDEPFIIMPHISCVSPWPIDIISTSVELVNNIYLFYWIFILYNNDVNVILT